MKKSFTLLELILVITLFGVLYTLFLPRNNLNKLEEVTNKLVFYLKETRYQALIDNKYSSSNNLWHKKRWTLKFFRCRESIGGIYFTIYSDNNLSGHVSKEDSLKDPLTNKYVYSSNYCHENNSNSKYVLLTKNFNIKSINLSCNDTESIGQISFSSNGEIYTKLSNKINESYEYRLKNRCKIELIDKENNKKEINIEPKTGFIY